MRAVIQRTFRSSLSVDGDTVGEIKSGLTVFLAVCKGDTEEQADYFARKLVRLRVFRDDDGKMNRSVLDVGGEILLVSQFSLAGKLGRGHGNRPDFGGAEEPSRAKALYERVVEKVRGMKKAFAYALAKTEKFKPVEENRMMRIVHTDAEKDAEELAGMVEKRWGYRPEISIMGPVIGSHVGPNAFALGYITKSLRNEF